MIAEDLWPPKAVANYLDIRPDKFGRRWRQMPGFPPPYAQTAHGRKFWRPVDIQNYVRDQWRRIDAENDPADLMRWISDYYRGDVRTPERYPTTRVRNVLRRVVPVGNTRKVKIDT